MNNDFKFPVQIFPDVDKNDFDKHQKKNVSEDFVAENLEYAGWNVYTPFVDTGIDLIGTKTINGEVVKRFIQVKTRALKDNVFGYTLKPKDFRDDPRHVFLLYSDSTNDFFILPMYDYLKFFFDNREYGHSHFAGKSFRVENNKINSLKYYPDTDEFKYSKVSFEPYRNKKGLDLIDNDYLDQNMYDLAHKIRKMKLALFYDINDAWLDTKIKKNDTEENMKQKNELYSIVKQSLSTLINETNEERKHRFLAIDEEFKQNYPELYKSHKRYVL